MEKTKIFYLFRWRLRKSIKTIQPKEALKLISKGWSPNKISRDEIVNKTKQTLSNCKKKLGYKGSLEREKD